MSLDVVLQQVLVHRVQVVAAHVVVVVGHRVAELLSIGAVFHIVGLVAVVIVIVAWRRKILVLKKLGQCSNIYI